MNAARPSGPNSGIGTFLAFMGLMLLAGCLLALVAIVMPAALGILLILGGLLFVGLFHYIAWGWWMSKQQQDEEFWEDSTEKADD